MNFKNWIYHIKFRYSVFFTVFGLLVIHGICQAQMDIEDSLVKIFVTKIRYDYDQPWQVAGQYATVGSGCIIEGQKILTSAHVIADSIFVQVRRAGMPEKFVARVSAVEHECDLALLEVEDSTFFAGSSPVGIGEDPKLRDRVEVSGFPIGGDELSVTQGVVSRVEMGSYSHSGRELLTVQIDAAINPGNSGGPVISDGLLVGIAFQASRAGENIGYMVPPMVIRHFLKNVQDKKVTSFPWLGIKVQDLESRTHRISLNMDTRETGILVTQISYNSSAWDILKTGDILMKIDGIDIASNGSVNFRDRERIWFEHPITMKRIGDKIDLFVKRDGQNMDLTVTLKEYYSRISPERYDKKPDYFFFGGLLFTRLTMNYLKTWGPTWMMRAPNSLLSLLSGPLPRPDDRQIILIQFVLPHQITLGYHSMNNLVLSSINGKKIVVLEDVGNIVDSSEGEFISFECSDSSKIVLDLAGARQAQGELMERFSIPIDRHFE